MRQGVIIYSAEADRMDVQFGISDFYGGLHCGQCFDVLAHGKWIPTRLEKGEVWYLVGIPTANLIGIRIRINC